MSYFVVTGMPVLNFWWCLLRVSKPDWVLPYSPLQRWTYHTFPEIHLWCYTCQSLDSWHDSRLLPYMHQHRWDLAQSRTGNHCAEDERATIVPATWLPKQTLNWSVISNMYLLTYYLLIQLKYFEKYWRLLSVLSDLNWALEREKSECCELLDHQTIDWFAWTSRLGNCQYSNASRESTLSSIFQLLSKTLNVEQKVEIWTPNPHFFFKVLLPDTFTCPILETLVDLSLFWISGDIPSGFQSQSRFCLIRFLQREMECTFPKIHLWFYTCEPLDSWHGHQLLPYMHQ